MIDDELLQELLAKATGLYNSGDYRAAIGTWREALQVDPGSQKAREGIQMATLLLAAWEPAADPDPGPHPAAPADGAPLVPAGLTKQQIAKRIDDGIQRVRGLLLERRYPEAIEGARGLVPIDPDSEEVQRLIEEAQQAFEAAPFIEEHLTLARELVSQERLDEAETECRKIFALDPTHPEGHELLGRIRKWRPSGGGPVEDAGGRTIRMDSASLRAAPAAVGSAPAAATPAAPSLETSPAEEESPAVDAPLEIAPDDLGSIDIGEPDLAEDLQATGPRRAIPDPEGETAEPVFDLGSVDDDVETAGTQAMAPAGESGEAPPAGDGEETFVDATTVVPPQNRLVVRSGDPRESVERLMEALDDETAPVPAPDDGGPTRAGAAPAGGAGPQEEAAASGPQGTPGDGDPVFELDLSAPEAPPIGLVRHGDSSPGPVEAGGGPAHEPLRAEEASPPETPEEPPSVEPLPPSPHHSPAEAGDWEKELESLNRRTGTHQIVGPAAAMSGAAPSGETGDLDLSSLLGDEDLGPLTGVPAAPETAPQPSLAARSGGAAETAEPARPAAQPEEAADETPAEEADRGMRGRSSAAAPRPDTRSRVPLYFALLGVLILAAGAAVWWFVFKPPSASAMAPPTAAAPPAAPASLGGRPPNGPLPTPLGSTSRQPEPARAQAAPPAGAPTPVPGPAGARQAPPLAGPSSAPAAAAAPAAALPAGVPQGNAAAAIGSPAAGAPAAAATAPPAPAPRSPEEARREAARHFADGRRLADGKKWMEARAELASVMALDPTNFEAKQLLDQVQQHVEQELKVRKDLDEARKAFQDKDYQGALWKLYRLPKDPALGDVDLYIRNAWFDWAIVGLKGGDATDAKQKLTETLGVDPLDADAKKLLDFANVYASKQKDRVFYSFVDTLRFRAFEQK